MTELKAMVPWGSTLAGKRIALTGHTGFKGTWFVHLLRALGASVSGFALPPDEDQARLFNATGTADLLEPSSRFGDVRDIEAVRIWLQESEPDLVFHFAAQSLVRRSYEVPVETFDTNVMGTVNLLQSARSISSIRAVVVITTDKCYRNAEHGTPFSEDDPLGGHDPYSASKAATEIAAHAFSSAFSDTGPVIATARAGNVFGGGDWSQDRLIPDLVRAIAKEEAVVLRNPGSVRPWQYVLEPLRGYIMLMEALMAGRDNLGEEPSGAWNFGPLDCAHWTVHDLAKTLVKTWGKGTLSIDRDPSAPLEAQVLRLNTQKANHRLGFTPIVTMDDALALTVDWYRAYFEAPEALPEIMRTQVFDYLTSTGSRTA